MKAATGNVYIAIRKVLGACTEEHEVPQAGPFQILTIEIPLVLRTSFWEYLEAQLEQRGYDEATTYDYLVSDSMEEINHYIKGLKIMQRAFEILEQNSQGWNSAP